MIRISADEIGRWRAEILQAEKFKEDEWGSCVKDKIKGVGENISYFERGYSSRYLEQYSRDVTQFIPLNIIYPIIKNVIPSLYYKNPYITTVPRRKQDEESSPYVAALLNYYYRLLQIKRVNQHVIFDAYVLGYGVSKIGYATKFGTDIPDEDLDKNRDKGKIQKIKEFLRLVKPKEVELPENIELNEFIKAESPYVIWVNPFDFIIDPTARDICEANYVVEKIRTTVDIVKNNKNYANTSGLRGVDLEPSFVKNIPATQIDKFKPIELYEIHYKTEDGMNILTLAKDQEDYVPLRHDEGMYEMEGFQYELLSFNKHGHKLYPQSEINITKGLQDRINLTFENILDQVDKFSTKMGIDETAITDGGKLALQNGELGAVVYFNKPPGEAYKEISLTQVKGDLMMIIDKMIDIISLETGITRAMLTGLTSAETATEAQIGQAGQNLRLSDKADMVSDYSNRQTVKLWAVIRQFVDLEEVELITGDSAFDDVTGTPRYNWLNPVDGIMREKMVNGQYDFQNEVGSTQKPDLPILRKQIENFFNILGQKGVLEAFQMQGYKINLAEVAKSYLRLFPDVFINIGKIIQPIDQTTTGLIPPQQPQQPGQPGQGAPMGTSGGGLGAIPQQVQQAPPNTADIISSIGGEKGQMSPYA